MTLLAAIPPGCSRKLSLVLILVAIHAERVLDLESRLLARRNMTGRALHLGMRKDQWEARLRMIPNQKS